MRFDVLFVFGTEGPMGPAAAAHIRRFLREAPHLLKEHSRGNIEYEVLQINVSRDVLELRCQLNVAPTWLVATRLTDADMIRLGVSHPIMTRVTSALILWIISMYGSDPTTNPLICAWRDFTGDQTAIPPISIKAYDYYVSKPTTRKNDTTSPALQYRPIRWHNDV